MYISELTIKNFRCFDSVGQTIHFNKGLTIIVGENDSGKSAILDAIRIILGTTDQAWYKIDPSDFHNEDDSTEIAIICKFESLSSDEQSAFLECLSYEQGVAEPSLYLHLNCKYLINFTPKRVTTSITSGIDGNMAPPSVESRELLRVTYLKALRDAYGDMQSGRNSRLSQIINSIKDLNTGVNSYTDEVDINTLSITGIVKLSNMLLANRPKLAEVNTKVTNILKEKLLLKNESVTAHLKVAGAEAREERVLMSMLEKLDLAIDKDIATYGRVGLGTSNILSIACELLLNSQEEDKSTFLLMEEPEAHIHAQRQLKVIQSLQNEANSMSHQIILTTHSPLLASVVSLKNIILMKGGKPYSLAEGQTKLSKDDYAFLERFLDATKANLFFAKSVVVVEGPAEELLLPTIAKLIGRNFTDYGVSIVNARGTGLSRFSKIFQRHDETKDIDIKVACIADRDIMPDCAPAMCINPEYSDKVKWPNDTNRKWRVESEFADNAARDAYLGSITSKTDGQTVKTFVSDYWTFEYDLARAGLLEDMIGVLIKIKYAVQNQAAKEQNLRDALAHFDSDEEKATYIYEDFYSGAVSKAVFAQQFALALEEKYVDKRDEFRNMLPAYILEAIEYVTEKEAE